jgi:hypothetical protein
MKASAAISLAVTIPVLVAVVAAAWRNLCCAVRGHVPMKLGPHHHADGSWIQIRDGRGCRVARVDLCERCNAVYWRQW